jgi:hypothetical protein
MWVLMALGCAPDTNFVQQEDTDVIVVYPDGTPDIFVEETEVDFGRVAQSGQGRRPLTIKNTGGGRLNLFAITVRDSTAITVDADEDFLLDGQEVLALQLVWAPAGEWPLMSTIEIKSNDPDERIVEIPVSGEVAP